MKRNIILVDLDNTMFNLLQGLQNQFNWYTPETQTSYSFFDTHPENAGSIYALFSDIEFFKQLEPIQSISTYVREQIRLGRDVRFYSNKQAALHDEFRDFFTRWANDNGLSDRDAYPPQLFLWDSEDDLAIYLKGITPYVTEIIDDYPEKLKGSLEGINLTIPKWPYNKDKSYEHMNPKTLTFVGV